MNNLLTRRYDGATEGAVTRCARIALGLPAYGTAHLVSPSGDIVNFGKPIEDGVTLYLEAVPRAHDPPALDGGAWSRRGILIKAGYRHDHGTTTTTWQQQQQADPSVPSHPRPLPPGTLQHPAPRLENGDYEEEGGETDHSSSSPEPADHTDDGSVSMNTTRQRIFSSWRSGPQKALQKDSTDDERRPLLTSAVSSESNASMNDAQPTGEINSSEDHNHDHHLHRRKFKSYSHGEGEHRQNRWGTLLEPSSSSRAGSGRVGGGSSGDCRRTVSGSGGDAFGNDETPAGQRGSIVKMKRINAHLASERTYLAWVRAMGKLFTAGTLSLTLASNTSGSYSVCFVLVGLVYFALCPYVVFVGLRRYEINNMKENKLRIW